MNPPGYYYTKGPQENTSALFQEEDYRRASLTNDKGRPKPNYRPVSLRWWYISLLILICLALAGLVLFADREFRGSDDTATIEQRSLTHDEAWMLFKERMDELLPRQENAAPTEGPEQPAPAAPTPEQSVDPAPRETDPADGTDNNDGESNGAGPTETDDVQGRLTTALVEVPFTTMVTKPGPKVTITTFTTTKVTSDVVSTITTVIPGTTYFTGEPPAPSTEPPVEEPTPYTTTQTKTMTITDPVDNTTRTTTIVEEVVTTPPPQQGGGGGGGGGGQPAPTGDGGPVVQPPVTKEIVTTLKKDTIQTVPVIVTKDGPPITYASTGKTTLYSTFTVGPDGKQIQGPVTEVMTSERGGTLRTYMETPSPTTYVTYGPDGLPTTVIETPAPITRVTSEPATRVVITSVSTPTTDQFVVVEATTYTLTSAGYYIGKFLPPLLAVLLALAIRAIDQTAKLYQPFAALSHPKGASGRDSLTLHFEGWKGFWRPFAMLGQGHPVPFLGTMAVWISAFLPPIASEAIGLKIHGRCSFDAIDGCALNLGVSRTEAYILVGCLLAIAILLIAILAIVTTRWKTGVFADPWCIAGAAALARNPDVRGIGAPDFRAVKAAVAEKQFTLGWFRNYDGREEYGLVLCDESGRSLRGVRREEEGAAMLRETAYAEAMGYRPQGPVPTQRRPPATFAFLTFWWRSIFLFYLVALLGVVIFYHLGMKVPDQLKHFMEGQKFGARFVSSALGVIVMICWECVFCSKLILSPETNEPY